MYPYDLVSWKTNSSQMECLHLRDFVFKSLVTDSNLILAQQHLELKKEGISSPSPIVTANKLKDM